mmetsp:Transcript_48208/g.134818  ORF Transcript_48208/g.134818 Transcript_48208/m.134818 type:complete len:281 (+) Transcript_48208:31-873(+)
MLQGLARVTRVILAVLDRRFDLVEGRVVAATLGDPLVDLLPEHGFARRRVLEEPAHPVLLLFLGLERAVGELTCVVDRGRLQGEGVDDEVNKADLLRLVGAELLTLQDHRHGLLVAHQLGQVLGAAPPREQAEHDLRQTELGLGARGGHAVVAFERPLKAAPQARAVDGTHERDTLRLDAIKEVMPVHAEILEVGLVLNGLEHFDVSARDKVIGLGRDKDGGLDVVIVLDLLRPKLLSLGAHLGADRVHLLRTIKTDHGHAWDDGGEAGGGGSGYVAEAR